jgi:hypothetical protein
MVPAMTVRWAPSLWLTLHGHSKGMTVHHQGHLRLDGWTARWTTTRRKWQMTSTCHTGSGLSVNIAVAKVGRVDEQVVTVNNRHQSGGVLPARKHATEPHTQGAGLGRTICLAAPQVYWTRDRYGVMRFTHPAQGWPNYLDEAEGPKHDTSTLWFLGCMRLAYILCPVCIYLAPSCMCLHDDLQFNAFVLFVFRDRRDLRSPTKFLIVFSLV